MVLLASLFNEWMRGNGRAMGNLCSVGVHKNVPAEACGCGCGARRGAAAARPLCCLSGAFGLTCGSLTEECAGRT